MDKILNQYVRCNQNPYLMLTLENTYVFVKNLLPYFFASMLVIEWLIVYKNGGKINFKEFNINIISGVIVSITQAYVQFYLLANIYPRLYEHRLFSISNLLLAFIFCFFLYSLLQYISHVLSHKIRLFWCLHEVHHSATEINASAGIRNSIFDVISTDVIYLTIPFLGIHPFIYLIVYSISKIWGTIIHLHHSVIFRIPFVNQIFIDPEMHHLHHAKNSIYLDKNYCETLLIFDKIFGTYVSLSEKPLYGSTKHTEPKGFWDVQLFELRSLWLDIKTSRNLVIALKYIFYPPGWQPETI